MTSEINTMLNKWIIPVMGEDPTKVKSFGWVETNEGIVYGDPKALKAMDVVGKTARSNIFKTMKNDLELVREETTPKNMDQLSTLLFMVQIQHKKYKQDHNFFYRKIFGGSERKAFKALETEIQGQIKYQQKVVLMARVVEQAEIVQDRKDKIVELNKARDAFVNSADAKELGSLGALLQDVMSAIAKKQADALQGPQESGFLASLVNLVKADENKTVKERYSEFFVKYNLRSKKKISWEDAAVSIQNQIDVLTKKNDDAFQAFGNMQKYTRERDEAKALNKQLADELTKLTAV